MPDPIPGLRARIGVRHSRERDSVVIVFGDVFYQPLTREEAMAVGATIIDYATKLDTKENLN